MITVGRIIRQSFVYLGIAITVLIAIAGAVFLNLRTDIAIPRQWIAFSVFTVILAFAMVKTYRRYWKRPAFWLALAALLAIHLAVLIPIVERFPEFKPIWYIPVMVAEGATFGVVCSILFNEK